MLYGERLKIAMEHRGTAIGRIISRSELARASGCSPQNISMILNHSRGEDQKLNSDNHAKAAAFLKVNADWLLNEVGEMYWQNQPLAPVDSAQLATENIADPFEGLRAVLKMVPEPYRARAIHNALLAIAEWSDPETALAKRAQPQAGAATNTSESPRIAPTKHKTQAT